MSKIKPPPQVANLETARHLAISGGVTQASLQYESSGWLLILHTASGGGCLITTARGRPRIFKSLEAAAKAVKSIFLDGCYIRLDKWEENQPESKVE